MLIPSVEASQKAHASSLTEAALAPFGTGPAVQQALTGVPTALLVPASETPDRLDQHRAFIDAAGAAGVRHLVYISFLGAASDATSTLARDHWATEEHLWAGGLSLTLLRDNMYAELLPSLVGQDGVIRGPAGDGRVSAVAQDDIAEVAALVLRDPTAHVGQTYDLTGPVALTLTEVGSILTAAIGRTVTYHPETVREAYASRAAFDAPDWQVDAWMSTYTAIAAGEMAPVSTAVADITGYPPRSLEDLLRSGSRAP